MRKQFINPPSLSKPTGYTHVAAASGGRMVYVSGQLALDAAGQLVGKGDLSAQTRQVYDNLKAALAAAGAGFADVIKLNTYVKNLDGEAAKLVREVRAGYLPAEHPPASTMVGVTGLAREEFLIEIEAIAIVKVKE